MSYFSLALSGSPLKNYFPFFLLPKSSFLFPPPKIQLHFPSPNGEGARKGGRGREGVRGADEVRRGVRGEV